MNRGEEKSQNQTKIQGPRWNLSWVFCSCSFMIALESVLLTAEIVSELQCSISWMSSLNISCI